MSVVVVAAWKLSSDSLPSMLFLIMDLVCGVGAKCIVQDWWGHGFIMDVGSHSWHAYPSINMSCSIGME